MLSYPESTGGKALHKTMAVISAMGSLAFATNQKIETSFAATTTAHAIEVGALRDEQRLLALARRIFDIGNIFEKSKVEAISHVQPKTEKIKMTAVRKIAPDTYKVKPGDSLWAIAKHDSVNIYELAVDNHIDLNGVLPVGKVLTLPKVHANSSFIMPPPADLPPGTYHAGELAYSANAIPDGSFGKCVVTSESSGHPQIWNGDHWGLYQFKLSTWELYGGKKADFGSAGPAEQNKVFAEAIAQNGQFNWIPYDHC